MLTRRIFLRGSAMAMVGIGAAPTWLARAASGAARRKVLVTIFQRGAADGLNVVVPFAEKRYYQLRPTLAIPEPGRENGAIDLDGRFALNPALEPLKALWDRKQLAIVEATGSPDPTRSHFDAQDYMESGTPGAKSTRDGWLNRFLSTEKTEPTPLRALALGPRLPRMLRGPAPAVAVDSIQSFQVRDKAAEQMLQSMYANTEDSQLENPGKETFEAIKLVQSINQGAYTPGGNARYPNGRLGQSLQQIARLIKADVGVEVAFADIGGWDHHANEVVQLPNALREFGAALAAFSQDMGDRMEDVVLVTMSEFGRTAHENGNRGTDHGHGDLMMVLGGPVKGGKIYGQWPGLEQEQLYEGRDLAVTTDFRDVLGELVSTHMGQKNVERVFPGHHFANPSGFLRS